MVSILTATWQDDARQRRQALDGFDIVTVGQRGGGVARGIIGLKRAHTRAFEGCERAALEIFDYIKRLCNRVCTHSVIGWIRPAKFERKHGGDTTRWAP